MAKPNEEIYCPVERTAALIGGKWKPVILFYLATGTKRFGEIAVRIPAISRKVLTQQLKELEKDELISRAQFKEIPPRVEYALTELGKSLDSVFKEMSLWGKKHAAKK